jgi:addiction module RelE/StbE family toxin
MHQAKSKKHFWARLNLFVEDSNHPSLRNHALKAKFAGLRSIDVTDDWRALYRWEDQRIIFVRIREPTMSFTGKTLKGGKLENRQLPCFLLACLPSFTTE